MLEEESPPTPPREDARSRRRPARWRKRLVLLGLVVLVLVLAHATRNRWAGPLVARAARAWAREALGGELTIERISGGWWRDLALEGVRLSGARAPLLGVEEARIELEYSLTGALRGAPGLAVRVQGRGLELAAPADGGAAGGRLADLPRVEFELTDLCVRRAGREPTRIDALRGSGAVRGGTAAVERLELIAGANRVVLTEAELDLSGASALELARAARGRLSAHLPDAGVLLGFLPLAPRSAELELALARGCAQLTGRLELEGGWLEFGRGELVLPASGAWEELLLDLDLRADFDDVRPLGALVGQELAGRWRGAIEVSGSLRAPSGRFVGQGQGLRVGRLALDSVALDLETDGKQARFERCEISGPELEAALRGGLQLEPLAFQDLVLIVSADAAPLAELLPFPCERAFLHARLDGPPEAPSGTFELSAGGATVGRLRVDDAEARGRIEAGTLEVAELHLTSGESTLEAAGTVRREGTSVTAQLAQLGILWRGTRVDLERGGVLRYAPGRFALEGLVLTSAGEGGAGRAEIALELADGTARAALAFAGYDAGPLLAPFLTPGRGAGRIDGRIEGSLGTGSGDALPALAIELALDGWKVDPAWPAVAAVLRGEFDGRTLDLERFELGYGTDEAARVAGAVRVPCAPRQPFAFAPGPVELRLDVATRDAVRSLRRAGIEPGLSATGPCTLELELAGEWRRLVGRLALAAEHVTLGNEATARACDLEAELELGERVRVERALFSAPSGTIRVAGEADVPLDVPRWLADRWAVLDAPLDLEARLDLADLGWVAGLSANLRRTSGQVAGRVAIGGSLLAPSLAGTLELREGEFRLSGSSTPVRNLAADLAFEDDLVRVVALTGEIGGAPVRVSGTLEPFGPFRRLDLALSGQGLLLARSSQLRLRADAELVIKGTPSQLSIGGELALAEGRYTTEISPFEELLRAGRRPEPAREGPVSLWSEGLLADAELDVHLGGKRPFEYRTNLLQAELRPDLWLRGTGAFPVLEGPVYVARASLGLPSGTLALTSGLLTFRREAPFSPEAALTAEMRVQRHSVRALATGTLDELEITLSSTPPLANDDLWLLVLTGQLPAERGEDKTSAAMEALAVFLARDALVRWLGTEGGDAENLLERFEIDVGAQTSQTGQPTGRVLFYLKPQTRRSGRATYLSAEIDEYDRVNYALGIVFRPR